MLENTSVKTQSAGKSFINSNEQTYFEYQSKRVETNCRIIQRLSHKEKGAYLGCSSTAALLYHQAGVIELDAFDVSKTHGDNLIQDISLDTSGRPYNELEWQVDGGHCPLPDNSYDLIVAGEIVEHLFDTDGFARELYRILKPGGTLIISTPNLASWYNRLRLLRGKVPRSFPGVSASLKYDTYIDTAHIRVNIMSEWCYYLAYYGFKIEQTYPGTYFHALTGGPKIRLIKLIDQLLGRFPTLAVYLTFVATK